MSEKVYVLNVYNTMTGQYELIQVTKEVFSDLQANEMEYRR